MRPRCLSSSYEAAPSGRLHLTDLHDTDIVQRPVLADSADVVVPSTRTVYEGQLVLTKWGREEVVGVAIDGQIFIVDDAQRLSFTAPTEFGGNGPQLSFRQGEAPISLHPEIPRGSCRLLKALSDFQKSEETAQPNFPPKLRTAQQHYLQPSVSPWTLLLVRKYGWSLHGLLRLKARSLIVRYTGGAQPEVERVGGYRRALVSAPTVDHGSVGASTRPAGALGRAATKGTSGVEVDGAPLPRR